jgi:transcriptional regulator with XRE-family HTH domain
VGDDNRLGEFLRARRELVTPEEAGLVARVPGRRVPGLRREEVATLAGISVEYLTRLERGKDRSPSHQVLNALAAVLRLDGEAVRYLHSLVWPVGKPPGLTDTDRPVPGLARALSRFNDEIAYILDPYFNIVACSRIAEAFLGAAGRGNQLEYVFLHSAARSVYPDWDDVATEAVAALRSMARGREDDAKLHALLGRLSAGSDPFRRLWARHDVHGNSSGTKRIISPRFGPITVNWDALTTAYPTAQTLVLYTADLDSESARTLDQVRQSLQPVPPHHDAGRSR